MLPPVIIAHRGASGYLPEHTLAAYAVAIEQGADFIEIDIVPTKDKHLICRHENNLALTTTIKHHPEFIHKKRSCGSARCGWWSEDLTISEIKSLRACEAMVDLRSCNMRFDGHFEIPTLREVLDFIFFTNCRLQENAKIQNLEDRKVGLVIEVKSPAYFHSININVIEILIQEINRYDWGDIPIIIETFDSDTLKELRVMTKLPLVQLIDGHDQNLRSQWKDAFFSMDESKILVIFDEIKKYAMGIAVEKSLILPTGAIVKRVNLVDLAHSKDLRVFAWTFRAENKLLQDDYHIGDDPRSMGNLGAEIAQFLTVGIDGFFTDHVDFGVRACAHILK
jgi:glycerophosphoryl diester phosphodiesterase